MPQDHTPREVEITRTTHFIVPIDDAHDDQHARDIALALYDARDPAAIGAVLYETRGVTSVRPAEPS